MFLCACMNECVKTQYHVRHLFIQLHFKTILHSHLCVSMNSSCSCAYFELLSFVSRICVSFFL